MQNINGSLSTQKISVGMALISAAEIQTDDLTGERLYGTDDMFEAVFHALAGVDHFKITWTKDEKLPKGRAIYWYAAVDTLGCKQRKKIYEGNPGEIHTIRRILARLKKATFGPTSGNPYREVRA